MPISKTKIKELNSEILYHEILFRKGEISFEEYNKNRMSLISNYYKKYYDDNMNCMLDYENHSEPTGLGGFLLRLVRKLF